MNIKQGTSSSPPPGGSGSPGGTGERWLAVEAAPYRPGSVMWNVSRERFILLGGAAAAILQVAHPQVAMGVAAHSRFTEDVMGRLKRTLDAVYAISFGTAEEVAAVRRVVARRHAPVHGESPGRYSAFDPDAQLWVLATLIDGALSMHRRFGRELSAAAQEEYYREMRRFGEVFGLDPGFGPPSLAEFEVYYREMLAGPLLGSHPLSAEVAAHIVAPRRPRWVLALRPWTAPLACEYVPSPVRERLQLPWRRWHPAYVRTLERLGGLALRLRLVPGWARYCPHYRRARGRCV